MSSDFKPIYTQAELDQRLGSRLKREYDTGYQQGRKVEKGRARELLLPALVNLSDAIKMLIDE